MNRIKEVLTEKGIKQTWLAEKLEKSFNMVNEYCNNRRQPSLEDLNRIAEILKPLRFRVPWAGPSDLGFLGPGPRISGSLRTRDQSS